MCDPGCARALVDLVIFQNISVRMNVRACSLIIYIRCYRLTCFILTCVSIPVYELHDSDFASNA